MGLKEKMESIPTDKEQDIKLMKLTEKQFKDKLRTKDQLDKISKVRDWGDKKIKETEEEFNQRVTREDYISSKIE